MGNDNSREHRNFTPATKELERQAASDRCRLCGRAVDNPKSGHILSASRVHEMRRAGTVNDEWIDNELVRSVDNCLLLCHDHHILIDSTEGLQRYSVQYLRRLKNNRQGQCLALVDGHICPRGIPNNWHLCTEHQNLGWLV